MSEGSEGGMRGAERRVVGEAYSGQGYPQPLSFSPPSQRLALFYTHGFSTQFYLQRIFFSIQKY